MMDFTKEIKPGIIFDPQDPQTLYWNNNGQINYRFAPVKAADPETFRFYPGGFAKDKKHCYRQERKLKGADPHTF